MTSPEPDELDSDALFGKHTSRVRHLWVVGLALYIIFIWYIGWRSIGGALVKVDPGVLLALMAVEAAGLWTRALKWRLTLGPGRSAYHLFFLSKAAGGWSPGRVGELAPLLLRNHRTPRMAAWIVVDRLLEIAATLGLGLIGLIALRQPQHGMVLTTIAALAVLVIGPLFVLTRRTLFIWLAGRSSAGSLVHRACMLLAAMSDEIFLLGRRIPAASAMTVVASCLDVAVGILLYRSFGFHVGFALLATVQCAHGIASAMPFTPNATGVPYLVAAGLLYTIGGIPKEVLAVAVGLRMVAVNIIFWSSFGLGMARRSTRQRAKAGSGVSSGRQAAADQAALFDRLAAGSVLYRYKPDVFEKLNALVPDKGRLLDVGCGDGIIDAALDVDRVVGLDISPRCVKLAADRGLAAVVGDAVRGLPFRENAFDTVCCFDVLHHLGQAWDEVLGQIDRVLRPDGKLVIVEPDARNPLIRWTQAPYSPIRTAPYDDEPAIDPAELLPYLEARGYACRCTAIHIEGQQVERATFPLWQRLIKAPAVLVLAWWFRRRPNKFAIVASKRRDAP